MLDWDCYDLPEFRVGKTRSQPSPYSTTEPFSGPLYVEQISDDVPVSWDVTIVCSSRTQASVFMAFLEAVKQDAGTYAGEFKKSILTEFGFVDHTVRIISGIPQPRQISNILWEYSFTIYAKELVTPDAIACNPKLWLMYANTASAIDCAVNDFLKGN